ncbi:hypothetical protein G6F61_007601 [Rhizopus arrhizus]|nr:hypothetical protein G6F61_007601 [Rhizopus arrhizus]
MKEKEAYSGLNFSLDLSRYPQPSPSKTHAQSQDVQFHPDTGVVTKAGKNRRRLKIGNRVGLDPLCCWCKDGMYCSRREESMCKKRRQLDLQWPPADGLSEAVDVGPGSVVGILGIGGLGSFGVLFPKAIDAAVIGLSLSKRTGHAEAMDKYTNKLTHILCTGVDEVFTWSF